MIDHLTIVFTIQYTKNKLSSNVIRHIIRDHQLLQLYSGEVKLINTFSQEVLE